MPSQPLEFEVMLSAAILLIALLLFAMMLLIVIVKLIFENQAKHPYRLKNKFQVLGRYLSQEDIRAKGKD